MSGAAPPTPASRGTLVLAVGLGLLSVGLAVRAAAWEPRLGERERLLARLTEGLLTLQGLDGAFDPFPDESNQPLVRRTGPHALATAALVRARQLGLGDRLPQLDAAADRALDVLVERQQAGGTFGAMPPGNRNPWPAVDTTAAGVLALAHAGRPADRAVLVAATSALARAAEYGLRDGWTRALGAMALDAVRRRGLLAEAGAGDLGLLLPVRDVSDGRIDGGDYAVAEAIAWRVRGLEGSFPDRVAGALAADPPVWSGQTADLQAWAMQTWLAARSPAGGPYLEALPGALADASDAPPAGLIPGGWFAEALTQTACGVLALAEILEAERGE